MDELNIEEIKERFDLLKKANNSNSCCISELAKELSVLKTDLMKFIISNHLHFTTDSTNKNKELIICDVFKYESENPASNQWLMDKQNNNRNVIFVTYDCQLDVYIIKQDYGNKASKWRNTKDKIQKLKEQKIIEDKFVKICTSNHTDHVWKENVLINTWKEALSKNNWIFKITDL